MPTHKERKKRRREIAAAVKKGRSIEQAAAAFGCSTVTVRDACAEFGVPNTPGRIAAAKRRKQIASEVKRAEDIGPVAEKHGVSSTYVRQAIGEFHSRPLPKAIQKMPASNYRIIAEILRGGSITAIATEYGVSKQRVSQIKKKAIEAGIMSASKARKT